MSKTTYASLDPPSKPLVWLGGGVRTPPFSVEARRATGRLLRTIQRGGELGVPHARPMPVLGARCHELRIRDGGSSWRVLLRTDPDAVLILAVFSTRTQRTPSREIKMASQRLVQYEQVSRQER